MIPEYCSKVIRLLNDAGFEAYVVGGAVRDILRGVPPHDFDIATSAFPEETRAVLEKNSIRTIIEQGIKHGTVTALLDGNLLEITSFRFEGEYQDKRHPDSVTFTRNIKEDVGRRDFTINAMYLDADSNVVDFNNGQEDLKNGVIRAVGNPMVRFNEDALRILRALRFASRFGFEIEPTTAFAMRALKENLNEISSERIHSELTGILCSPYCSSVLRQFHDIIAVIVPELSATVGFEQHSKYHNLDVFEHTLKVIDGIPFDENGLRDESLAYAAFFHDIGKPVVYEFYDGHGHMQRHQEVSERIARDFCARMKFSNKLRDDICCLILLHDTFPAASWTSVHKFMVKHTIDIIDKLYILQRADILAHSEIGMKRMDLLTDIIKIRDEIVESDGLLSLKDLAINGNDIKSLGVTDGRRIGELLNLLFDSVLNMSVRNEYDDCMEFIRQNL